MLAQDTVALKCSWWNFLDNHHDLYLWSFIIFIACFMIIWWYYIICLLLIIWRASWCPLTKGLFMFALQSLVPLWTCKNSLAGFISIITEHCLFWFLPVAYFTQLKLTPCSLSQFCILYCWFMLVVVDHGFLLQLEFRWRTFCILEAQTLLLRFITKNMRMLAYVELTSGGNLLQISWGNPISLYGTIVISLLMKSWAA